MHRRKRCSTLLPSLASPLHAPPDGPLTQDMVAKGCIQAVTAVLPAADYSDNPSPFLGLIFAFAKLARTAPAVAFSALKHRTSAQATPTLRMIIVGARSSPAGRGRRAAPGGEEDPPLLPRLRPLQQRRRRGVGRRCPAQPRSKRPRGDVPQAAGGDPGQLRPAAVGPRAVAAPRRARGASPGH